MEYILANISAFVLGTIDNLGYWGVFFLMALESANIPVPSEVIMPFSGFLVSQGSFAFWPVVAIGAIGNLAGSLFSYGMARYLKTYVTRNRSFKTTQDWFNRYGIAAVFWGRLVPVIRTFISFPAGIFKLNIWYFSLLTLLGSFIWSTILVYPGYYLGEQWYVLEPIFRELDLAIFILLCLGAILVIRYHFRQKQS